ncbi:MAG TPA: hypothetical protein PK883_04895 [Anaerolineaceae bacterium]|nr:hypothetical protein [Anaerolineaceae bacterium]
MRNKVLLWVIGGILLLSLAACGFETVTPPPTQSPPTVAVPSQTPSPSPTSTVPVVEVVTAPVRSNNAQNLILSQRAAVRNIQDIVWSQDSSTLSVITQNSDSDGKQVYGVSVLSAADLTTRSMYTSVGNRIPAVAVDGHTSVIIDKNLNAFSLVDTGISGTTLGSKITDYAIGNISFSPDLRYVAVTKQESWEVVLYDLTTLEEVRVLSGFETAAPVFDARFDFCPQWIVWFSRGTLQLQEVETGRLTNAFYHEDFVSGYTLSPDGMILASSAAKTVNGSVVPAISLWDTTTSSEIRTLVMNEPVYAMQFSPDGKLLAAAVGKDLQIWDATSATLLTTLTGHSDIILQIAFSPDQHTIATAGLDNQLLLWQITE